MGDTEGIYETEKLVRVPAVQLILILPHTGTKIEHRPDFRGKGS